MTQTKNILQKYRKSIDDIDDQILKLLSKRHIICKKIGTYKKINNIPIRDMQRENNALDYRLAKASKLNLNKTFISLFFKSLFKECRKLQRSINSRSTPFDKKPKK